MIFASSHTSNKEVGEEIPGFASKWGIIFVRSVTHFCIFTYDIFRSRQKINRFATKWGYPISGERT